MKVEKQIFPSWAPAQKPIEHWKPLAPHSPWTTSLPIVGLLIHLFPAKCIVSVSFAVINCTVCLLFPPRWLVTYCSHRLICLSSMCQSFSDGKLAFSPAGFFLFSLCVFLFTPLTYLLASVIPSHALPLELASLSLHLAGLSYSPVCLCPSVCLFDFPHMGLLLHAGAGLFPAGVPV